MLDNANVLMLFCQLSEFSLMLLCPGNAELLADDRDLVSG